MIVLSDNGCFPVSAIALATEPPYDESVFHDCSPDGGVLR